jgi:hypothetical protein
MKGNDPLSFKMALISASWLMTMITVAIFYMSSHIGSDSNRVLYLFGGGFSAGCAAIFGLLRKKWW